MIPKILHHIWLGGAPIPPEYLQWKDNWRNLHPDWAYVLWTDKDVIHLENLLKRCKSLSSKSNVVRLWVIKEFGGVYADMDFDWNKNINSFLSENAFVAKEDDDYFCNAFFGALARHKWVTEQFNALDTYVDRKPPWGPTLMTNYSENRIDLKVLPSEWVYPYFYNEAFQDASNFKNSFLVHHWNFSWKNNKDLSESTSSNLIENKTDVRHYNLFYKLKSFFK
jgi:mannosyltransferase OCH1-like enzyme